MTKHITSTIDEGTHRVVSLIAAEEDRTFSKQVARILREWANRQDVAEEMKS